MLRNGCRRCTLYWIVDRARTDSVAREEESELRSRYRGGPATACGVLLLLALLPSFRTCSAFHLLQYLFLPTSSPVFSTSRSKRRARRCPCARSSNSLLSSSSLVLTRLTRAPRCRLSHHRLHRMLLPPSPSPSLPSSSSSLPQFQQLHSRVLSSSSAARTAFLSGSCLILSCYLAQQLFNGGGEGKFSCTRNALTREKRRANEDSLHTRRVCQ